MASLPKGKEPVRDLPNTHFKRVLGPSPQRKRPTPIHIVGGTLYPEISVEALTQSSSRSTTPTTPRIVITSPQDEDRRFIPRRRSGSAGPIRRPLLLRKAATAPPGAFKMVPMTPRPPRRAISARSGRPGLGQRRGSSLRSSGPASPGYPRISQHGTPESRSVISRRKNSNKWSGRGGLKTKSQAWRKPPTPLMKKDQPISNELRSDERTSFSEKMRVKEALKGKKLGRLNTNIVNFQERDLPDTPTSLVSTPRELYGPVSEDVRPTTQPYGSGPERPLAPRPASGNRAKHFSLPLSPHIQRRDSFSLSGSWQSVKWTGPCKQNAYLPGPIRVAERGLADASRRGPVAATQAEAEHGHGDGMQQSDWEVMDGMAEYFESFGFMAAETEDGLDRFWEHEQEADVKAEAEADSEATTKTLPPSPRSLGWKARIRLGLDETPPPPATPPRPLAPRQATQAAAPSPSSWMTRQQDEKEDRQAAASASAGRHRLRDLLRSAKSR